MPELAPGRWHHKEDLLGLLLKMRESLASGPLGLDKEAIREYHTPNAELNLRATGGIPTVARCVHHFPVAKLEKALEVFPELATIPPGRVVLPHECASQIYARAWGGAAGGRPAAVHLELKNTTTGSRAYVGLAEVSEQQDSVVFAPSWLLRQLFLREGDEVRVRLVTLPLCSLVRLQPHSREFYELVGDNAQLLLQEALAQMPALTAGLSIPVELPCARGAVLRQVPVFVARLEAQDGSEVLAATLPSTAGVFGEHEVRVDFLPATDLQESGKEYKERMDGIKEDSNRLAELEAAKRAQAKKLWEAEMEAAIVRPCTAERRRAGDGTTGLELCFRLPNGKQLRRKFPADSMVWDLKNFVLGLRDEAEAVWKPAKFTSATYL